MKINFVTNGNREILQIDDARIAYRNFRGEGSKYNREGDRNFVVIIPNQDIADALINDKNQYGVGWNVKIKPPRDEDDQPFIYLPVKVKFTEKGPKIYLESGSSRNTLDEGKVAMIDDIDISRVDLDVRPYDDIINGKPFRAAYLQSMRVVQNIDRFQALYAEEEYPRE